MISIFKGSNEIYYLIIKPIKLDEVRALSDVNALGKLQK